jgi:hypothetical protein
MVRRLAVNISTLVFALAPLGVFAAPPVGQNVEGVITNVDLHGTPRHITVQTADGQQTDVRIHVATTKISFTDPRDSGFSPELSNLRPGERVRAQYNGDQPTARIEVLQIPENVRSAGLVMKGSAGADTRSAAEGAAPAASNKLMVRLIETNHANRGEVRADVAGTARTFRVDNPKVLASFREGDLVVLTVDDPNAAQPVIQDVRPSTDAGVVDRNRK